MKIAMFSDIHGNKQALKAIINDIKNNDIDKIYCLGDILATGPSPRECLDIIINNKVNMILGNHEIYYLKGVEIDDEISDGAKRHQNWVKSQLESKHREFLSNCPLEISERINNVNISYRHFLFNEDKDDLYPFDTLDIIEDKTINNKIKLLDYDVIFIGHHHDYFEIDENDKRLVCLGSSGCTKDMYTHYIILTINDNYLKIEKKNIAYNREDFEMCFNNTDYAGKEVLKVSFFN